MLKFDPILNSHLIVQSLLVVGLHLSCVAAQDLPAQSLGPRLKSHTIDVGLTHFYFSEWAGPKIPVWTYIPRGVDLKTAPILVMMHGAERGAARYLSEWDQVADQFGFIVIAPEFGMKDFPSTHQYQRGNVYSSAGSMTRNPPSKWSFAAIEPVVTHVQKALGNTQSQFTLYGHSAGAQFAHRYLLFVDHHRVKRFLVANSGWYTFPDLAIEYPFGLKDSGVGEESVFRALERDVVVLLGDADTNPNDKALDKTEGALLQGPHRFARGKTFFANAKGIAETNHVSFGWRLQVVEGAGHSNGAMAVAAGKLVK